jgi:hypothetical protein
MTRTDIGVTKSYQDHVGERLLATGAARSPRGHGYAPVDESYDGATIEFSPADKRGAAFLAGSEGIIGVEMGVRVADGHSSAALELLARDGSVISRVEGPSASRVGARIAAGWKASAYLSLTVYDTKEGRFFAEAACVCYDPALSEELRFALETFKSNIAYRIKKGVRPGVELSQEQFVRVLESGGKWYLTKSLPRFVPKEGQIVYKHRRTPAESLVAMALEGRPGCRRAATAMWLLVAVAAIAVILWLLLRSP